MWTRSSVTPEMAAAQYWDLFVNRMAYTVQSEKPGHNGKHYYYRPKEGGRLSLDTIQRHLAGQMTIALYAINPKTQRSKWVAIDADYENALEDLLKLQWELHQDGVEAALEKSRRGAHLWIFADQPLLARDCRLYIYNLARRLRVPVKGGAGLAEGIEVFPRQDELKADEFGNAIRGPLGVHRAVRKRYWFYGADAGETFSETAYDATVKFGLEVPVPGIGNLSLQPTYELFYFRNKVLGRTLSRDTFGVKLTYSFERYTNTGWRRAMKYKSSAKNSNK